MSSATRHAGFLGDAASLGLGLVLAQALLLGVMPWWSRLYTPADFAVLGVWAAVAGVVSVLVTLRYETSVMLPQDDAEARRIVWLGLLVIAALSALVLGVTLAAPRAWRTALALDVLGPWLPAAVLSGSGSAVVALGFVWLNRRRRHAAMNAVRIAGAFVTALAGVALGLSQSANGLLIAHFAGVAASLAVLGVLTRGALDVPPADELRRVAGEHRAAPLFLWPNAVLDVATQQLPFVLAASWFSVAVAGQFNLAWRTLALPLFLASAAIGTVFYQRFARCADDRQAARRLLFDVWRWGAAVLVPVAGVLMVFGPELFAALFGASWREAGRDAALLAPMLCIMAVSSATSGSLIVLGRQRWAPLFGALVFVCRPLAFWYGARRHDLQTALVLWAVFEVLIIAAYNLVILRALRR